MDNSIGRVPASMCTLSFASCAPGLLAHLENLDEMIDDLSGHIATEPGFLSMG